MPHDAYHQILAAAAALFAEQGFANTSMNDVVQASGMSKGGVYWHFASKEALLTALLNQFFDGQISAFGDMVAAPGPATDKLLWLAQTGGQAVESMLGQFPSALEFYALAMRDEGMKVRLVHYFTLYRNQIQQIVVQAIEQGEWRPVEPRATADSVVALFEGVLLVWSLMPDAYTPAAQLEAGMRLLIAGLEQRP